MPGLCHCPAGPHAKLVRARGAAESRPDRTGLRTRRAYAPQSTQARGQAPTKKGKTNVNKKFTVYNIHPTRHKIQLKLLIESHAQK